MGKRIVIRRSPKGRLIILIKRKKGDVPKCAICKRPLRGIKKYVPSELRRMNKSQKRVSRIYGGYLCHQCLEKVLKEKVRQNIYNINITNI